MREPPFFLLLAIASEAGLHGPATTSTSSLAGQLGCSQQTISRQLRELEARKLIRRRASSNGIEASLTEEGRSALQTVYLELSRALQAGAGKRGLTGIVETGLKEGAYYLSFPQYQQQFRSKLGFTPFTGTLNLRVELPALLSFLDAGKEIYIDGFQTRERSFGGLKAYRVHVNGKIPAALIVPDRTTHRDVAEVISEKKLRDALGLKDGDKVTLTLKE